MTLEEPIDYPRGAMTSTKPWMLPHEVADLFAIRLSRVAQLIRTGILPYLETADFPLINIEDANKVADLFPELLSHFREEKRCATGEEIGEDALDPSSYRRPSTVALMRCVNLAHPTVPIGR